MEEYKGQLKDFKFETEIVRSHHKKKDEKSQYKRYCNNILTFDIETTSAWLLHDKPIPYVKGKDAEYWNSLQPLALCYLWQFSVDDKVYFGRELNDFNEVLNDLDKDVNYIIWVHNLSFEFMFLCNIFEWENIFARSPHKPIKCTPKQHQNIEFRCTYYLTRLSLESWGEQLGIKKLVGNLDYEKIRTPKTKLTKKELEYAERDCVIVYNGIKDYLKKYYKQRDIPLTQTGTVRRETKMRLTTDIEYVKKLKKLVPRNAEEYKRLQTIFSGGYTHANRLYSGSVITDYIEHYDFASSYPTVMVCEKYPMTPWLYLTDKNFPKEEEFEDKAYILHIKFYNIESTSYNTYIQASKVIGKNIEYDNGRVIKADEIEMYMTEQDYLTIKNNYKWDIEKTKLLHKYVSKKEYLPTLLVEYILELYGNKTSYKDVIGKEDIYMQSKQYINSMFGMCVTAIVQANVIYENDEWKIEKLTKEIVEQKLKKLSNFNDREKRYFLSYSWGCWVTAYARRNLWKIIEHKINDNEKIDDYVIYCDTDSAFIIGKNDFTWYNEEITNKLKKACKDMNIDFELVRPTAPNGKRKQLGLFEKEKPCIEFITLGAKRYVERREDNKLYLTVSGINKQAVELLDNNIENFRDGFYFDKDADCVTKKLSTYISDMPIVKWDDGYISDCKYGINLRRNGYLLSMTDEYKKLINYVDFSLDDIDDEIINTMRGRFIV